MHTNTPSPGQTTVISSANNQSQNAPWFRLSILHMKYNILPIKCVGTCISRKPNQAVEDKLNRYEVSGDHLEHSMFGAQHLTHEQQHLYIHRPERRCVGHTPPSFPRHPHHLIKTNLKFTRMLEYTSLYRALHRGDPFIFRRSTCTRTRLRKPLQKLKFIQDQSRSISEAQVRLFMQSQMFVIHSIPWNAMQRSSLAASSNSCCHTLRRTSRNKLIRSSRRASPRRCRRALLYHKNAATAMMVLNKRHMHGQAQTSHSNLEPLLSIAC